MGRSNIKQPDYTPGIQAPFVTPENRTVTLLKWCKDVKIHSAKWCQRQSVDIKNGQAAAAM